MNTEQTSKKNFTYTSKDIARKGKFDKSHREVVKIYQNLKLHNTRRTITN